jgi:hypothetical protein
MHLKRTLHGRERLLESRRRLAEHGAPFLTEVLAQRPLSTACEPSLRRHRDPCAGNGFVDPRDKRPEMTSEPLFRVSETANTSSHTRNCAENSDCSPTTRNIQLVKDCVVVDAGRIEPVSTSNSLLTGKRTGNFAETGLPRRFFAPNRLRNSVAYNKIPYATEQGIIWCEQGIFYKEQGVITRMAQR